MSSQPSRLDNPPPPPPPPPYTLPSYFARHHDSPHKWGELAYLEHLFPEGAHLTNLKHQNALNRWTGAIKWLQRNSKHAHQATKLLEQYSNENSKRVRNNWYNRRVRNGKITKKGQAVYVNRSTIIDQSTSGVRVEKSVIHGRDMNYYGGGRGSDSARSRSGSPPIQEADPPIQGATVHDVDHVDVDHNRSNRENPSSVHSDPAGSPDREIIPSSSCYESDDALGLGEGSTSFVFSITKRVLADVVRDSNLPQAHLARAGIIVLYDKKIKGLFKESEWEELVNREPPLPQLEEVFETALKGYASDKTPNQFRHTARTHPYRAANEPHDDSKHAKAEWVDMVILWMLKLYSGYGDLRAHRSLEGWFDACIWSVIFDLSTFSYKWMMPRRKEVQSWSLKSMATHTEDSKDKSHQRSLYDGIIYDETHFDRLEFGIFEVAKDFDSLSQTKLVNDRHKLYRGMHGMGRLISKTVDHDPEAMKFVQVVGVQNMEFSYRIQLGTPIAPDEIIISQGEVQTIPATFDKLQTILLVLKSVCLVMEIMDRSEKAVEERLHRTTVHKPELMLEKLAKGGL